MTFTQIGALVGFLTGVFVLIDRFLSGRPHASLTKRADLGPGFRSLECTNTSRGPILLTRVRSTTKAVQIWYEQTIDAHIDATYGPPFSVLLDAGQTVTFPIVVSNGEYLDEGGPRLPFLIIVSWRKTSSMWLPQL